jgi:hypothetical protein
MTIGHILTHSNIIIQHSGNNDEKGVDVDGKDVFDGRIVFFRKSSTVED